MNRNLISLSVIIPTYKPGKYLWTCLESINKQTLRTHSFELLIVLNGCCEPWESQIKSWESQHPNLNITIIQTDAPGVSNARNIGIDAAKGEYITFIDDDDYVSPSYLENLLECSSADCVALTDSIYFEDEDGKLDYNNHHHKDYLKYRDYTNPSIYKVRRFFNGPVMKLIHRDIIGPRRFDCRFANGEDSLFMALISDKIKNCRFCPSDAVYYRRIRANSATTAHRSIAMKIRNNIKAVTQYSKYWIKRPFGYNFLFMSSRIAAQLKTLLVN